MTAIFLSLVLQVPASDHRPNVILIMADDMGYECLRANGGIDYQTPHLDRLAEKGVRFTEGHATPICTPSRVQIMSGLYNSRNYTEFGHMDPEVTTFGNLFQEAGYATCVVGKWQLQGGYVRPQEGGFEGPYQFGFDEYCLWQVTRTSGRKPNRYANPGLEINGKEVNFKNGEYGPDIINRYACDFVRRQAKAEKSFLLYYPMILPHWPFEPTPDSKGWDPTYRRDDKTEKRNRDQWSKENFVAMVTYADKMVGNLLKTLGESGVREDTLVLFVGDNGTDQSITSTFQGKPYRGGKGKTIRNGTHVPMIAHWPGRAKAGSVCGDLIDFTDILPTMLDTARITVPETLKPDGRSFLPQIQGKTGRPRDWIYCYFVPKKTEFAMSKRYKLYPNGQFFDLQRDPGETSPIKTTERNEEEKEAADKLEEVMRRLTRK